MGRHGTSRSEARTRRRHKISWRSVPATPVVALTVAASLVLTMQQQSAVAGQGADSVTSNGVHTHGSVKTTTSTIGWLLRCDYSHSGSDDPIMMPGMPGMSHLHDFFGNKSTNAASTLASMEKAGSTCGTAADTAGYWAPALLVNGRIVPPTQTSQQIYYRFKYAADVKVVPLPQDLRVVVGDMHARTVAANPALRSAASGGKGIYWECDGNTAKHYTLPPSCSRGIILENVQFPSCWDGKLSHGKGALNDNAHLAYAPDGGRCPSGFPIAMPRISLKVKYTVGKVGSVVTLSSGPATSAHADFWNTWQPAALRFLVDKCINAHISCGTNPSAPMGQ
jgi:Domain of unknown function (DUF1996)